MWTNQRISYAAHRLAAAVAAAMLGVVLFSSCESTIDPPETVGLSIIYGNQQIRWPGGELLNALSVQATDESGNDIQQAGISVTWLVQAGGGSVAPRSPTTDAQGRVLADWTLGPTLGIQSVEASTQSQGTAAFTATAADAGPLLFVSDRGGLGNTLYLMNEDGSDVMQLVDLGGVAAQPDWAPDGTRIVAIRDYDEVVVLNADGSDLQVIADDDATVIDYPSWSPDGTRIAFAVKKAAPGCLLSDYNIYTVDPDGGNRVQLTDGCGGRNTEADWSPDGSKIVFCSRRDAPQDIATNLRDIEIYLMNADGTEQVRLTDNGGENDVSPVWSADGSKILFVRWVQVGGYDGTSSIWQMNPDGSSAELVTELDGLANGLELSPDGTSLMLGMGNGDNTDIYVLDLNDLVLTQLTDWSGEELSGAWREP